MRTLLVIAVLVASTAAHAQPGVTEPIGYHVQQPSVQLQLSEEQQERRRAPPRAASPGSRSRSDRAPRASEL